MKFRSDKYIIRKINRKTRAKGWASLREGNIIRFSMNLKKTIRGRRGGLYSTTITITVFGPMGWIAEDSWENTQNTFLNNLETFELEELQE
jgi:hypothetical protein